MANFSNSDRENVAGVTVLGPGTSNPTTGDDDTISLSGSFLLSGTTTGLIDGQGQTTADTLVLSNANLRNVDIENIEATDLTGTSTHVIDAAQIADLGDITVSPTSGFRSFLQLSNAAGQSVDFSNMTVDPAIRLNVSLRDITTGDTFQADFSGAAMGAGGFIDYNGNSADETVFGSTGSDILNVSSGNASVTGGAGDDTITASSGDVTIEGGADNDVVNGTSLRGVIDLGIGDDTVSLNSTQFFNGVREAITVLGGTGQDDITLRGSIGDLSFVGAGTEDDIISLESVTMRNSSVDGGTGTDLLRLRGSDLSGTDFSGIETTLLLSNATTTVDAGEVADLGALDITNTFATGLGIDANLRLQFAGSVSPLAITFSNLSALGANERLSVSAVGQVAGQQVAIDFSGIAMAGDAFLQYTGSVADETITGTAGNDFLNVSTGRNVADGQAGDDSLSATSGESTLLGGTGDDTLTANSVTGLVDGGADDDTITVSATQFSGTRQPITVLGGSGSDTVKVTSAIGDGSLIDAGTEDDTLDLVFISMANSTVDGGDGNDNLRLGGSGLAGTSITGIESTLIANSSTNTIDADQIANLGTLDLTNVFTTVNADANLLLSYAGLSATTAITTSLAGLSGLDQGEILRITTTGQVAGQQAILDFSGLARAADTSLQYFGSVADETITGTVGDDQLSASSGTNVVNGADGDDSLSASSGFSTLSGGSDNDTITASSSSGLLDGGSGDDEISQGPGFFTAGSYQKTDILGGTGADDISVISVQGDGSLVDAGTQDDTITLTSVTMRNATIDGGDGTDALRLGGGTLTGAQFTGIESTLFTNSSNVTVDADQIANLGALDLTDVFTTTNFDANLTLNYAGLTNPPAITTSFAALSGLDDGERLRITTTGQVAGQDVVVDFSGIGRAANTLLQYTGSNANETVTGTAGDDVLNVASGTNEVTGGAGNDSLQASSGLSTLLGGTGDDTLLGNSVSGLLDGGADDDVITSSTGFTSGGVRQPVTILGGFGFDTINVIGQHGENSTVDAGSDDDTISFTSAGFINGTVDGGTGVNALTIANTNLTGTDISNIGSTLFATSSTNTVDADQVANLGAIDFTNVFDNTVSFDGNLTLNFAGLMSPPVITVNFDALTELEAGERVSIRTTGQMNSQDVEIDFSGIGRTAADTFLRYTGATANETVIGTAGDDALLLSSGNNSADAGMGDDSVTTSSGISTLLGGLGDDTLIGTNAVAGLIDGGADNDVIEVSATFFDGTTRQNITILGGSGSDDITLRSVFGDGSDIDAGENDDAISLLFATLGASTLDGGSGTDTLNMQGANLTNTDIEGIEASNILQNSTNNVDANEVADLGVLTITDVFAGQNTTNDANITLRNYVDAYANFSGLVLGDNERLGVGLSFDGDGDVTVDFSGASGTATSRIAFTGIGGGNRNEKVIASEVVDILNGGNGGRDTISYEASDAAVSVNLATNAVSGGFAEGDIISNFENATGSALNDTLTGDDLAAGNILKGLGGDDTYMSGAGDDTVVVSTANGDDIWSDFGSAAGLNRVDLRDLPKDAAIISFLTASDVSGNTVLSFSTGGSITLTGEALADFDISDVILEDGVYAIDESYSTNEDTILTGNILNANPPFNFADLEVINQMLAAPGGIEVQDFTAGGVTWLAGETATLASGATLTVLSSGAFTYDPVTGAGTQALSELLGQTLAQDFSYTAVSTITGATDQGDVSLTVTAVNDAPEKTGDPVYTATEDGPAFVADMLANYSDVDDQDVLSVVNVGALPAGVTRNGSTLTLDPSDAAYQGLNEGETTVVSVTYDVQDAFGAITTGGRVDITVTGSNDIPTMAAGTLSATEDAAPSTLDLSVLGVDADDEDNGASLSYVVTGQPAEGTASVSGTTLTFDPGAEFQDLAAGETRDVTVGITATDARNASATNSVTVTVTGVNDAPTLGAGVLAADEDGAAVTLDLATLGDDVDSDDDGASLTYTVATQPAEGTASVTGTTLTFNPGADFQNLAAGETRDVTVGITATDARNASATNSVTVTVTGVNDAPTLGAGVLAADEDGAAVTLDLATLGDDADSDDNGASLTYTVATQPAEGTASVTGTTLTFNPGADFQNLAAGETRDVVITVQAEDGNGATVTNDVTVTVTGENDAPAITNAVLDFTVDENTAAVATITSADTDTIDDATYSIAGGADAALFRIDATTGALSFVTPPDFETPLDAGQDNVYDVDVQVSDGIDSDTQAVSVTVADVVENAVATVSVTVVPTSGDEGDAGTQSVVFTLTRSGSSASAVTVALALAGTAAAGDDFTGTVPSSLTLAAGESTRTFTLEIVGDTGPEANETIEVAITSLDRADHAVGVSTATHTIINDDNADPIAANDGLFAIDEDAGGVTGNVLINDTDADAGDTLVVSGADAATALGATVTDNGDGTFNVVGGSAYDALNAGDTVTDSFEYTVSDGNGGTDTATVSLTVTGRNDAPTVAAGVLAATEDGAATVLDLSALGDDADAEDEGSTLTYSIVSQPGEGTASLSGTNLSFDPATAFQDLAAGETRDVVIQVAAMDAQGAVSNVSDVTVTVTGVDDLPEFTSSASFAIDENSTGVGVVAAGDVDGNGQVGFTISGGADAALFAIDQTTGALSFVTAPDFENPGDAGGDNIYDVIVRADGGDGSTSDQAITVTVGDVDEGGGLNDVIGTNGIDRLIGTNGNDRMDALAGPLDIITGGAGADVFDFTSSSANGLRERKIITDFTAGEDLLDLGAASVLSTMTFGTTTYVNLDGDFDQIVLFGVSGFDTDYLA